MRKDTWWLQWNICIIWLTRWKVFRGRFETVQAAKTPFHPLPMDASYAVQLSKAMSHVWLEKSPRNIVKLTCLSHVFFVVPRIGMRFWHRLGWQFVNTPKTYTSIRKECPITSRSSCLCLRSLNQYRGWTIWFFWEPLHTKNFCLAGSYSRSTGGAHWCTFPKNCLVYWIEGGRRLWSNLITFSPYSMPFPVTLFSMYDEVLRATSMYWTFLPGQRMDAEATRTSYNPRNTLQVACIQHAWACAEHASKTGEKTCLRHLCIENFW